MRKRAYRSTEVKFVNVMDVVSRLSEGPVSLGLDIGKSTILAVVRDATGHFERHRRPIGVRACCARRSPARCECRPPWPARSSGLW